MTDTYHLDYETRSPADIRKVGGYKYIEHPDAKVLMMAIARNDEEPHVWYCDEFGMDLTKAEAAEAYVARRLLDAAIKDAAPIYAHNAQFERGVTMFKWPFDSAKPTQEQWRCTAAMARRAALPAALDKCGAALGLDQTKYARGSALMKMFSIPNKKTGEYTMPYDDPEAFREYGHYCKQDVRSEQAIHQALKAFEMKGDTLATFLVDAKLNDRGVPVNVPALIKTQKLIEEVQTDYVAQFNAIVGLNPTQRQKVLDWLNERGYPADNLQSVTVHKWLDNPSWSDDCPEALRALQLREYTSYAAVTKIKTMLHCACEDGMVRGTLMYYGAHTGRWSGRLIQTQNLKRPTIKDTHRAYEMLCEGACRDHIELMYGNPLEMISSCVRHFIKFPDHDFIQADYAAVEARIVCWLADQVDALDRFRDNIDSYVDMASMVFSKSVASINGDERWLGKQTVLGCGFGMAAKTFYDQCKKLAAAFNIKGLSVTKQLAKASIKAFRTKYDKVSALWGKFERAATNAVKNPGRKYDAGSKVWFSCVTTAGKQFLVMKLPSGRSIVYPEPKIEQKKKTYTDIDGETHTMIGDCITFWGQIPNSSRFGRISTYGAMLVENATQGVAADLMAHGTCVAEARGFEIATLIHDEALAKHDLSKGQTPDAFAEALTDLPCWAAGLPLKAEAQIIPYYLK